MSSMREEPAAGEALAAYAARAPRAQRADWVSGVVLILLVALAFGVVGTRILSVASGPAPPGPGARAPVLLATTLAGERESLASRLGQVVLVDFWATWCPPCVASMPTLERLHQRFRDRGFTVLGVNEEPGLEDHVAAFLRQRGISFPTLVDAGSVAPSWGVYSYPTSFLVGRDGRIRATYRGPASEARLAADVEAALLEPPSTAPGADAR
jgi:thiol-disulfide isomerase/thioredoxin